MNTVTAAHFARMCNVSREAIRKAIKAENIKSTGTGRKCVIQVDHRITQEYLRGKNPDAATAEPEPTPAPTTAPKPRKKPVKKKEPKKETPPEEITAPEVPDNTPPRVIVKSIDDVDRFNVAYVDKSDLQKFKIFEETKLKNIQVRKEEGKLISRELIKKVFSKIYTVDTEQLRTLEERLAPVLCGIFKVNEDSSEGVNIRKEINGEVSKVLKHIKMIVDNFLESLDEEKK